MLSLFDCLYHRAWHCQYAVVILIRAILEAQLMWQNLFYLYYHLMIWSRYSNLRLFLFHFSNTVVLLIFCILCSRYASISMKVRCSFGMIEPSFFPDSWVVIICFSLPPFYVLFFCYFFLFSLLEILIVALLFFSEFMCLWYLQICLMPVQYHKWCWSNPSSSFWWNWSFWNYLLYVIIGCISFVTLSKKSFYIHVHMWNNGCAFLR